MGTHKKSQWLLGLFGECGPDHSTALPPRPDLAQLEANGEDGARPVSPVPPYRLLFFISMATQ